MARAGRAVGKRFVCGDSGALSLPWLDWGPPLVHACIEATCNNLASYGCIFGWPLRPELRVQERCL